MSRPQRAPRTLVSQILMLVAVLFAGLILALALIVGGAFRQHAQARTAGEIEALASSAAQLLSDGLAERSREIAVMSQSSSLWRDGLDGPGVIALLARASAVSPNSLWIGVADRQGRVVAATGDLLKGQSVTARPWFTHGTTGAYVGDVHAALLLEPHLPPPPHGEPLRFLDFAAPIQVDGMHLGVLAAHVSWDWARQVSERVLPLDAAARGVELLIFDRTGELLYAPGGQTLALRAAGQRWLDRQGRPPQADTQQAVRWTDGQDYLAAAVRLRPGPGTADLGWHVVVRAHAGKSFAPARGVLLLAGGSGFFAALVVCAIAWWSARRLGTDLRMLTQAASRIEAGDVHVAIPIARSSNEVLTLSSAMARMTRRLIDAQAELEVQVTTRTEQLQAANNALVELTRHDPLTGVLNRRGFEPKAQLLFDLARRGSRPLSVCMIDADHFKAVNDTCGHAVGDQVLRNIAQSIALRLRRTDVLARWGGEEFVLLLPDTALDAASALAEALRLGVAQTPQPGGLRVTVSIGLALSAADDDSPFALIERADRALYRAKHLGRDQVSAFGKLM